MEKPQLTNAIIRRNQSPLQASDEAPFTTDLLPPQQHFSPAFIVRSEVMWPTITPNGRLKGPPQIRLQWNFRKGQSGTILGFRRHNGFGKDGEFGELIVKSNCDGEKYEHLESGEYFYSFFTATSLLGLFRAFTNEVMFTQTMPSAAKVLELIHQAIEFTKLQREFQSLTEVPPAPEDDATQLEREFSKAMDSIDTRSAMAERLAYGGNLRNNKYLRDPGQIR